MCCFSQKVSKQSAWVWPHRCRHCLSSVPSLLCHSFPGMWHIRCQRTPCTKKYYMGSLQLGPSGWMWSCILTFCLWCSGAIKIAPSWKPVCLDVWMRVSVSTPQVPLFPFCKHTNAGDDGDVKGLFGKHSSQEAFHSDFTTLRHLEQRRSISKPNTGLEFHHSSM